LNRSALLETFYNTNLVMCSTMKMVFQDQARAPDIYTELGGINNSESIFFFWCYSPNLGLGQPP
jgi:hypothetical protein